MSTVASDSRARRPLIRRAAFQAHLWIGLALGAYLSIVAISGTVLLFADEIHALMLPDLYRATKADGQAGTIDKMVESLHAAYPQARIRRIDAPSGHRETYAMSVEQGGSYRTVFAHPETGAVLGMLPKPSFLSWLEGLHGNLLSGTPGRAINSVLALVVLALVLTGIIVWWPSGGRWWVALSVRVRDGRLPIRPLHGTIGIWAAAFIAMFAATGAMYYFGPAFYQKLGRVSKLTPETIPRSGSASFSQAPGPELQRLVDQSRHVSPGRQFWGIYLPMQEAGAIRVVFGPPGRDLGRLRWSWTDGGRREFYFDQYTGRLLATSEHRIQTAADFIRAWLVPMHTGEIGGMGIKVLWAVMGIAPVLLFILGGVMWWIRVVRRSRRPKVT